MNIFRANTIQSKQAKQFQKKDGEWQDKSPFAVADGLILTDVADEEHDAVLNLTDGLDPLGLRGFMVNLVIKNQQQDDPKQINLGTVPVKGQILRDLNRLYYVSGVQQSSNFGVAAFVTRITEKERDKLVWD